MNWDAASRPLRASGRKGLRCPANSQEDRTASHTFQAFRRCAEGPELRPGAVFMLDSDMMKAVSSWGTSLGEACDVNPHDCWAIRHRVVYFGEGQGDEMTCCHFPSRSEVFLACLPLQAQKKAMGLLRLQALKPPAAIG